MCILYNDVARNHNCDICLLRAAVVLLPLQTHEIDTIFLTHET